MEGIENIEAEDIKIANKLDLEVKLLGISEIINNKLFETVHPCLVSKNTYIGNVNGVMNAVIIEENLLEKVFYKVRGQARVQHHPLYYQTYYLFLGNIKYPFWYFIY